MHARGCLCPNPAAVTDEGWTSQDGEELATRHGCCAQLLRQALQFCDLQDRRAGHHLLVLLPVPRHSETPKRGQEVRGLKGQSTAEQTQTRLQPTCPHGSQQQQSCTMTATAWPAVRLRLLPQCAQGRQTSSRQPQARGHAPELRLGTF